MPTEDRLMVDRSCDGWTYGLLFRVQAISDQAIGGLIVGFTSIPSLPSLIREFLINQKRFDVGFAEYGLRVACLMG